MSKNLENTPAQVLASYAELRESINKLPWKKLFWFVHTEYFYTIHFFAVRFLFFLAYYYSVYDNFLQFLFIAVCWRFVRIKILLFFQCIVYLLYILLYSMYINTYISLLKLCNNNNRLLTNKHRLKF